MADGRCVNTIVLILPMRFAMEDARSMEIAAMMEVVKKMLPKVPSGRENLRLKK